MKFTFVISQSGVVNAGLCGKVSVQDLCLLNYLYGWFTCNGAKIEIVNGRKYVWLHFERAIEELPLLFNPEAKLASRKNQLSGMLSKLRGTGLVETAAIARRLFIHLTDVAIRLSKRNERAPAAARTPTDITTPQGDEHVTPGSDRTITSRRDEYLPSIINETGTSKNALENTTPSPLEGEAECILVFWNSFPGLLPAQALTRNRARNVRNCLLDPWWKEHWREGIQRVAGSKFANGNSPNGWRATLDWFLGADTLMRILEGTYDNRVQQTHEPSLSDAKEGLRAAEALIIQHKCNPDSVCYSEFHTKEDRDDYRKLKLRRKELLRIISGTSESNDQW